MRKLTFILGVCLSVILFTGEAFADATNSNTGANSSNNASLQLGSVLSITNLNDLMFNNLLNVNSNTGGNKANANTGNGSVTTGNVNTNIKIDNNGNTITTNVGGVSGGKGGGGGGTTTPSGGKGGGPLALAAGQGGGFPTVLAAAGSGTDALSLSLVLALSFIVGMEIRRLTGERRIKVGNK